MRSHELLIVSLMCVDVCVGATSTATVAKSMDNKVDLAGDRTLNLWFHPKTHT